MSAKTIRGILAGRPLLSIGSHQSVAEASKLMADHKVGALVVMDGETLAGIVSERDIVFRGVACDLHLNDTEIATIMTADPKTVDIEEPISDALALKLGNAFRHLPVTEDGKVVGLLSYRDIPPEYVMMFERFREMAAAHADEDL